MGKGGGVMFSPANKSLLDFLIKVILGVLGGKTQSAMRKTSGTSSNIFILDRREHDYSNCQEYSLQLQCMA